MIQKQEKVNVVFRITQCASVAKLGDETIKKTMGIIQTKAIWW